ncbi:hypothetical protein A3K70_00145 [Candidatus Bathyarchaeota archaeon RBG_16_48_13]|nr:MAG: hypothetical protein A3K70_00145 [Candidatus Bathyarchaeota archaeon RBG_16_48_13]
MPALKDVLDIYMKKVQGIQEVCDRCLKTERWGGSVVLMVVDAAFTSIGLNYFTAVVPKVEEFSRRFAETGEMSKLEDLAKADMEEMKAIWRNERSWMVAKSVAAYLSTHGDDRLAFRAWAEQANLEKWRKDPIGMIKGVGVVTFQYLRMMGGVDTVMPDKIVKRVINTILEESGHPSVNDDIDFVKKTEWIAHECGYKPIELCWMTWLIQPEGKMMRMKKYSKKISKI